MDERSEADQMGGAGEAAHFCKAPSAEEMESWRRHWREEYAASHPPVPVPPMANVALALDLSGDGIREHVFQGVTYRLNLTTHAQALRLLQVYDLLGKLEAIGQLIGEPEIAALHTCYVTIADVAGDLLTPRTNPNPFREAGSPADFGMLLAFLLDTGNEIPQPESEGGTPIRYDAAYHLMAYQAVYGKPTTWRAFCAGERCLRRLEAQRSEALYYLVTIAQWGDAEMRNSWLAAQQRDART